MIRPGWMRQKARRRFLMTTGKNEEAKMIVLNVTYKCKPGMRGEFLQKISVEGIDFASRQEEGNIKYDYYLAAADEDELVLIEKWKDAEAIAVHGGQAHYARLGELKKEFVEKTDIERFETAE